MLQTQRKTFFTFLVISVTPLLAISLLSLLGNLKFSENLLRADLNHDVGIITNGFDFLLRDRQTELQDLAWNPAVRRYVTAEHAQRPQTKGTDWSTRSSHEQLTFATPEGEEVKDKVAPLLRNWFYATIAVFSSEKRLLFLAEPPSPQGKGNIVVHTADFLPDEIQPDDSVWTAAEQGPRCRVVSDIMLGKTLRCTTPVFVWEEKSNARGALVADVKLDSLIAPTASRSELPFFGSGESTPRAVVIILDESGEIVYHTNDIYKHQRVEKSMPYFAPVANSMIAGEFGAKFYSPSDGNEWLASYTPLSGTRLSLAVTRNYSDLTRSTRRFGWLSVVIALLTGIGATFFLSNIYLKRTQSLDRLAEGVGAIAQGNLGHRIELQSSDDLRPLADNVGLVTNQLREQLARESETRQFQSFIRLSAILTHDLKNAIEALSLTVTNMEHHFDNKEFRADAMKSLTSATDNLRALVARLSNPVTTLSGEHKRPQPIDLLPMLKQVISITAEPARRAHEININLPESLFALVDVDRINKVVENLIINALEAMGGKRGRLSIEAGKTVDGKPFFSITDTGQGMSRRFIDEKLFHPFATTKSRGVGLGLYTCREVVRANGGSIEVHSQEGSGTTFIVVLPSVAFDERGGKKPYNQSHS